VTVLEPVARLLPFTARVAPDEVNGALPRTVPLCEKVTVPVGMLDDLTMAVSSVEPAGVIVEGLAVTEVDVVREGALTVTVAVALEPAKFPDGV